MSNLYDAGYHRSDRLKALTAAPGECDVRPLQAEVLELWRVYTDGAKEYAGVVPNLLDFAAWVLGNQASHPDLAGYREVEPAEVFW